MSDKKDEERYKLAEIPTEVGVVIQKDNENMNQMQVLVEILNKLDRIEKNIVD